jgi:hypothetical protein
MPATLVQNATAGLSSSSKIGLQKRCSERGRGVNREVKWLGTILIEGGLLAAGMHWGVMVAAGIALFAWAEKDAAWMRKLFRRSSKELTSFDGRFFPEPQKPVVRDVPAGQLALGPVAPEEDRRRVARDEFDTFTNADRLALQLVSAIGPISEGTLREQVTARGGTWTADIPRKLEHLFASHDFNGRFFILPEYQEGVRELTRPPAPEVHVGVALGGIDPRVIQRAQLAKFILEGEQLERRCIAQRGSNEVETASVEWYNRVVTYLAETLGPDYGAEFKTAKADASTGVPAGYPHRAADRLLRIRGRVACLNRFTRELRG